MAGLLVSVRSVDEAVAAVAGGAAVIDVKEPDRGPLGRADTQVWAAVRRSVPPNVPVSVALGELAEWTAEDAADYGRESFDGITFRKIGLANSGTSWVHSFERLRRAFGPGPAWVVVAYSDWPTAGAPGPDELLDVALNTPDCAGVLIDTWDKCVRSSVDESWRPWLGRAREGGRFVALAGGLDDAAIERLAPLEPDLFAVRGSACLGGDRRAAIDSQRVARLVSAAAGRASLSTAYDLHNEFFAVEQG